MTRYYEIDGDRYPSVTTILNVLPEQPWLTKWKQKPGSDKISARARVRGTLFHYRVGCFFAERFNLPKPDLELRDDEREYIDSQMNADVGLMWEQFQEFAEKVNLGEGFIPRLVEHVIYNKEMRYAGTVDLIAEFEGCMWVVDVKTGKSVYDTYEAQIAAYSKCTIPGYGMYEGDWKVALVRFHPETNWQFKEMNTEKGWALFMKAYEMFQNTRIEGEVEVRKC